MLEALEQFNMDRAKEKKEAIRIGIGIHTGSLMLGTVGEEDRLQTTVIGETVNIAARTESMTKIYGSPIIITEMTKSALKTPKDYATRLIDRVRLRGISYEVNIYEFLQVYDPSIIEKILQTENQFQQARAHYLDKKYAEAAVSFEKCLQVCPQDNVAKSYLERCKMEQGFLSDESRHIL